MGGKFVKPVLKKVAKPANKLAKFDKSALKSKMEFRDNLKSTGKDKYALEEEMTSLPLPSDSLLVSPSDSLLVSTPGIHFNSQIQQLLRAYTSFMIYEYILISMKQFI